MSTFFVKRDKVKLDPIQEEEKIESKIENIELKKRVKITILNKNRPQNENKFENNIKPEIEINSDIVKSIGNIKFTLLPNEEVKRISVLEISTTKFEGEGTLFDRRLGVQDKNNVCETCGEQWKSCPGHFGHIELAQPIPHPIQYKLIIKYLQIFCKSCYNLIINADRLKLLGFNKYKNETRVAQIYEESEKILVCPHCSSAIPKYFNNEDSYFYKFTLNKSENKPYRLTYGEIHKIFSSIPVEEFQLAGFDDEILHPKNLIIENLLVLPPCARPYVLNGDNSCHDDLTYKYIDIIKVNNKIKETTIETTRNALIDALYFHVKTLFDNSKGKSRESSNKRPIKCLKSRLKGKTGQIRNNLQGKRCDFNGRTVITAEANCMADEIVIPVEFSKKLTYPVTVNALNIAKCQRLVDDEKVTVIYRGTRRWETQYACKTKGFEVDPDDKILRKNVDGSKSDFTVWRWEHSKGKKFALQEGDIVIRDGIVHHDAVAPKKKHFEVKIGDIIERHLQDGDLVVLNRQPTLWKGSMRAKRVKIRPGKTIRFALSSTAAYNADFDGDEMNIFPAQSELTKAECAEIISTEANFMSGQDSKPMLSIKQDGMTGGYKLTFGRIPIKRHQFNDIISLEQWDMNYIYNKLEHIQKVYKWTGMLDEEIERIKQSRVNTPNVINEDTIRSQIRALRETRDNTKDKKLKAELKQQMLALKAKLEQNENSTVLSQEELEQITQEAEDNLLYTGHSIFSMLLPNDFEYSCINGMSPDGKPVKVTRGVLVSGTLNKKAMGSSSGSLMHHIAKDYGYRKAIEFVSYYQIIINNFLLYHGFSIGIGDCITKNEDEIAKSINKCLLEASALNKTEQDPDILEAKLMSVLNKARDIGQIQANKALEPDNNLVAMIRSGAKGNDFNIAQITGLVGQQAVSGNRIPKTFGDRTLPHYCDLADTEQDTDLDYNILKQVESRGFVKNSYFKGLSPAEFFFHAAGGREGLIDSACKTAETGYIQRKITKMVEDLKISYQGPIVNSRNNILEFSYGNDNFDASRLIDTGKENYSFIDIGHTVECLNKNHEWNNFVGSN